MSSSRPWPWSSPPSPGAGATRSPTDVEQTGKLFPDFNDPRAASSMTIVKYDEATGELHPFQVAQVGRGLVDSLASELSGRRHANIWPRPPRR